MSMGKSVTATLIGLLVEQGLLALDEPAPIPAWTHGDDPRRRITVRDLMQMSSGLRCSGSQDPRSSWGGPVPQHVQVYMDAIDVTEFALTREPELEPQTVGRYRNCDTLALAYIARRLVTEQLGENFLAWPQRALFDRIG